VLCGSTNRKYAPPGVPGEVTGAFQVTPPSRLFTSVRLSPSGLSSRLIA
jgi:hypothetical protein